MADTTTIIAETTRTGEPLSDPEMSARLDFYLGQEKQFPNDALVQYNIGMLYREHKNNAKAVEHLTQAVRLRPREKTLVLTAVELLIEQVKYGQAESILKRYLKLKPGAEDVRQVLSTLQLTMKNGIA